MTGVAGGASEVRHAVSFKDTCLILASALSLSLSSLRSLSSSFLSPLSPLLSPSLSISLSILSDLFPPISSLLFLPSCLSLSLSFRHSPHLLSYSKHLAQELVASRRPHHGSPSQVPRGSLPSVQSPESSRQSTHILADGCTVSALPGLLLGPFGCLPPQGGGALGRPKTRPFYVPNGSFSLVDPRGSNTLRFGLLGLPEAPLGPPCALGPSGQAVFCSSMVLFPSLGPHAGYSSRQWLYAFQLHCRATRWPLFYTVALRASATS